MTDKIIIDGIDVSGCDELTNYENVLFVCQITGKECELNHNCLYKRLKQLEAENARLKEIQKRLQDDLKRINEMYFKESNKNYKLSEISLEYNARRCIENLYKDICDDTKSVQETYILMKDRVSEFLRIHKVMTLNYDEQKITYRQTLQEIKEIAEQSNVDCIYRISVIRKILTKAESEEV